MLGLRYRVVSLTCGRIAYVDEGSGPPILLLHGAPMTSLGFVRVIRGLRGSYRVIAPDFPGFGRSSPADTFGGSLAEHSAFVREFCHELDLRGFFTYVNDSSACIAFPALAGLDQRLAGLVVASTVPLPLTGSTRIVKLVLRDVVGSSLVRRVNRALNLLPWLVATVAPWLRPFSGHERRLLCGEFGTAAKRDRVIEVLRQMGCDDAFMESSAQAARNLARAPVLLLYGQFDPMRFFGAIPHFKRVFPRHTVRVVPMEEHFPILASGHRVAAAVDEWIRALP